CALLLGGGASCWGENSYGEVGDGTTVSPRLSPTLVSSFNTGVACTPDYAACTSSTSCCSLACTNGICLTAEEAQPSPPPYAGFVKSVLPSPLPNTWNGIHNFLVFDVPPSPNPEGGGYGDLGGAARVTMFGSNFRSCTSDGDCVSLGRADQPLH